MDIGHVFIESDVLNHELKTYDKISNFEISYDKTWQFC